MPEIKVCMLTSGHPALDARIFHKESISLKKAGYEVTVLAPLNKEGVFVDIGGNKIADSETTLNGIRIIGFRKRAQRYNMIYNILLLLSSLNVKEFKLWKGPLADLMDKGAAQGADVYHCHELWSLYAGIRIKKRLEREGKKPRLIYDVHEFRPTQSFTFVKNRFLGRILSAIIAYSEKRALKYADYAIAVNEMVRVYLLIYEPFIKTEVIDNCSSLSTFPRSEAEHHKGKITICHSGTLWFNRGLKLMVEVMRVLKERYGGKVELLIVGDVFGKEREYLENRLKEDELHDVIRRTGWLPYERVGEAISQADIGIIFTEFTPQYIFSSGNKLFDYMRSGLPIVSVDLPEASRIISESQCGLVAKDRNVESLVGALSVLIDDEGKRCQMGENAKRAAYNQYSWEQMEKKLLRVYNDLLSKP